MESPSPRDQDILRRLGEEIAEAAADPVNRERAELWRRLNDLDPVRPVVWINEIPWHELAGDAELTPGCAEGWFRGLEVRMRRTLYQWRHLPGDMVVSDYVSCPLAVQTTPILPAEQVDVARTDEANPVVSRHYHIQIREPEDIDIISFPTVTHDEAETESRYACLQGIFDGILSVRKEGHKGTWYTPWDWLIRLWGVQEAMMDLVDRPDMVNAFVERYAQASLHMLDQWEALRILTSNADNTRVGSGGYGYTSDLPAADDPETAGTARGCWGCSNAQIFSEVSPDMHWEFALRHDLPWLARWGLTYYGCCEQLHHKAEILRRIPNLRKISMSPRAHMGRAAQALGKDYVLSHKPNPAILAEDRWRPDMARRLLSEALDQAEGCAVEVIMKDISTVRREPRRLREWAELAREEVEIMRL
jgi:hypothetical protein